MALDEHPQMLYRPLGSTGEKVSAVGVGGFHLASERVDERLAVRIVRTAIDRGITFMDNCWDYNAGASEMRMGKALRDGYRDQVFLMTKIDGRSRKEATRQLEESLRRLQVDHIDLVQHTKSSATKIHIASSPRKARMRRWSRLATPASCATSASRATRTPTSTSTCWTSPPTTALGSMPSRCR